MTLALRRAAGAAVLALTLVAAGCGSDDTPAHNAYVDQVNRIQTEFSSAYTRIAGQITSTTSAREDRVTLEALEREIDETSGQLRGVEAPDSVSELHTELVEVLDGYGEQLAALSDDLLSKDTARAARATTTLARETSDTSADFLRKINEINGELRE